MDLIPKALGFPVLKLPFVAFKHLTKIMDLKELRNLSYLSNRTCLYIKCATPRNKYKLKVFFDFLPSIILERGRTTLTINFECFKNYSDTPDGNGRHNRIPCTETFITKMATEADFLSATFNCDVYYLKVEPDFCERRIRQIINWLVSRQPSIQRCFIYGGRFGDDETSYLINNCKITQCFYFHNHDSAHFIRPFYHRFDMDILYLDQNPYVSLEDVSTFDCVCIRMNNGSMCTVKCLNRFLKSWINGSNARMRNFIISIPYFEHDELIDGIEVEERDASFVRTYKLIDSEYKHKFKGGTDIRNKQGKLATFQQEPQIVVHEDGTQIVRNLGEFSMIVWD